MEILGAIVYGLSAMETSRRDTDPLPLAPASAAELDRVERSVLARGESVENLDWLGFMFFSHGRMERARGYYTTLCAQVPENASYHYYLAETLWDATDRIGAKEHWERVTQLDRGEYARLATARLAAA